jgi:hypothetical protein
MKTKKTIGGRNGIDNQPATVYNEHMMKGNGMTIASDLKAGVERYIQAIKADYAGYSPMSPVRAEMIQEFDASIRYEIHRKFIKVITGPQTGVHSFIMLDDDGKFKRGDILKAASWKAPAKNFARGNVLKALSNVRWTGA